MSDRIGSWRGSVVCWFVGHRHDVEFACEGLSGTFFGCHRCGLAGWEPR